MQCEWKGCTKDASHDVVIGKFTYHLCDGCAGFVKAVLGAKAPVAAGTQVKVSKLPSCDICKHNGVDRPAYADASLGGTWGYVCRDHFDMLGCQLGVGKGQVLVVN